jgi:hypothetical protein
MRIQLDLFGAIFWSLSEVVGFEGAQHDIGERKIKITSKQYII